MYFIVLFQEQPLIWDRSDYLLWVTIKFVNFASAILEFISLCSFSVFSRLSFCCAFAAEQWEKSEVAYVLGLADDVYIDNLVEMGVLRVPYFNIPLISIIII